MSGGTDDAESTGADEDFGARFMEMAADLRHADAVKQRTERNLRHQLAGDEGLLDGLLGDLSERGNEVSLESITGRTHRGCISGLGADYCVIAETVVALKAVAAISIDGSIGSFGTREAPAFRRSFADLMADWAVDRPGLQVWISGRQQPKAGVLALVGADVIVLMDGGQTTVVPFNSVLEAKLFG